MGDSILGLCPTPTPTPTITSTPTNTPTTTATPTVTPTVTPTSVLTVQFRDCNNGSSINIPIPSKKDEMIPRI